MFVKQVYLYCDGDSEKCVSGHDEAFLAEQDMPTIKEYKESIKERGWLFRKGNKAYCPECRKDLV